MDYQALAQLIPVPPALWNHQHTSQWLTFIHLPALAASFQHHHIQGSTIGSLTEQNLVQLGVNSSLIRRKLLRWVKEGLPEFEQYLLRQTFDDKENIAPRHQNLPQLQRNQTFQKSVHKVKPQLWKHNQKEEGMVIRSCDGSLAAYYVMKEHLLKIGRSSANIIRSLEVSVEEQHAQITKREGRHYLQDKGTEAGTFLKIETPRVLRMGTLIEMGSFLVEVTQISKHSRSIRLTITHMISSGKGEANITLGQNCSFYSFGRRKSNNFSADDEHLSGLHAKIFIQRGEFVIEDMQSTNGTWLRLSPPLRYSEPFELQEGSIFKIGTTITYQCLAAEIRPEKMDIEYQDGCLRCRTEKRNIVFIPCKHNAVCNSCADNLESCPLCSSDISERIKIFI